MAMEGDRWLSEKAAEWRFRTSRRCRMQADALREAWRLAAAQRGWLPVDWWVPGVDAVARALADGRDAAPAYARLGRDRAEAGHGLRVTLEDVAAPHAQMALHPVSPPAVPALVQAWAAVMLAPVRVMVCAGFATAHELRACFTNRYQDLLAGGLAVLTVEVPAPATGTGWEAVTAVLEAGARTPSVFAERVPIARTTRERAVTLIRPDGAPHIRRALGLDRVQVVTLPDDPHTAAGLIAHLAAGPGGADPR